jgi:hypothetical protein
MKKTIWIKSLKCFIDVSEENRSLIESVGLSHEFEKEKINVKGNQRTTQSLITNGNGIVNDNRPEFSVRDKKHTKKHKPGNNTSEHIDSHE